MQYSLFPIEWLKFWYINAPLGMLSYFSSLNVSFMRMFSISLLLRTYFQPIKNEYRQGLVGFSIGMGIFVKTLLLLASMLLFLVLLCLEFLFICFFVLMPVLSVFLLFVKL